jgi:hypothetical protein
VKRAAVKVKSTPSADRMTLAALPDGPPSRTVAANTGVATAKDTARVTTARAVKDFSMVATSFSLSSQPCPNAPFQGSSTVSAWKLVRRITELRQDCQ